MLGGFAALRDGEPLEIGGANERRLLALLALHPNRDLPRREIAAMLWPDVDFEVSGNRLRTALVGLRKNLEPSEIIRGDHHSLTLDSSEVETDVARARQIDRNSALATDAEEERATLAQFIDAVGTGMLPDWNDEFLAGFQEHWRRRRIEALQRSADLALAAGDHNVAVERAESVLAELPFDPYAWSVVLNAKAQQGLGAEAVRGFSLARKRFAQEGLGDFPSPLLKLAKSIRDGSLGPPADLPALPAGADQSIVRAFQRMLVTAPDLAAQFVCHDAFRLEILRTPEPSAALLESMALSGNLKGPKGVPLRIMAMRTFSLLHDVDRVLELGAALLKEELDVHQKRLVLTVLSFSHFLVRDFDRAFQYVDQAIEVAEQHGYPHHVHLTRADRALYLWHTGEEDRALEIYLSAYEAIKDEDEPKISYAPAFLCGIIGSILVGKGKLVEAEEWLRRGYGFAQSHQYREQMHQIEPVYGYVRAVLGDSAEASRLTISGLAHALRSQNLRAFGTALDYAAGALAVSGHPRHVAAVLVWGERLRAQYSIPRSPTESKFAAHVLCQAGDAVPDRATLQIDAPKRLLQAIASRIQGEELPGSTSARFH